MISSVGGAFTTMVARACAVLPPLSATVAVIACVPERSVVTVRLAPVPSTPSRLEAHEIAEPSAPSSASVAVPSRRTTSPGTKVDPSLGLTMTTAGGAFTATVTSALAVFPPRSLTEARITCVPERSVPTASAPPVPSAPSRLDVHWMLALRLPSSASLAAAARRTSSPGTKLDPVVGAAIVTVGAAFTTTVIPAVARLPPASVTFAVTVWVVPTGFVAAGGERTSFAGAAASAIFATKASPPPLNVVSTAPAVVGKSLEVVDPVT